MIGLITLTDSVNADPILINPNHISFICRSNQPLLLGLGLRNAQCIPNSTVICLGAVTFQVNESVKEVVSALTRLKNKYETSAIALKKRADRDYWQDEDDFGETADL